MSNFRDELTMAGLVAECSALARGAEKKPTKASRKLAQDKRFYQIFVEACQFGHGEMSRCQPEPVDVVQREYPLDDNSRVIRSFRLNEGLCGFAGVVFKPATQPFARWMKESKRGYKMYSGGWYYPIHEGNQSIALKEAYARGMIQVFEKYGIKCYLDSRLD